jgi:hypothetical protein
METIKHTLYNIVGTIEYNGFIEVHNENFRKHFCKNELKNYEPDENISICRADSNVNDDMTYISTDILRDLVGNPYKPKKNKSVSFGEAHGYYIPSRRELFQLVNKTDMWWSQTDFINMRLTASNEVREFIRQNPIANYKMCVKQLWTILDFDAIYAKLAEKRQVL